MQIKQQTSGHNNIPFLGVAHGRISMRQSRLERQHKVGDWKAGNGNLCKKQLGAHRDLVYKHLQRRLGDHDNLVHKLLIEQNNWLSYIPSSSTYRLVLWDRSQHALSGIRIKIGQLHISELYVVISWHTRWYTTIIRSCEWSSLDTKWWYIYGK